jgi:hypothetical protein
MKKLSDIYLEYISYKNHVSYKVLSFVTMIFLLTGLCYTINISYVTAQAQQNSTLLISNQTNMIGTESNSNNTKSFKVTIDSLVVNDDHDPLTAGEWLMDVYVNNELLDLFPGSISVNNGDTVHFTADNSVNITVPNDEQSFIRIATVGWENDIGFESLPIFFPLLDTRIPFYVYLNLVQEATVPYVMSPNDPNGYTLIQFNKDQNFGVGIHSICSERNVAATVPSLFEGDCDYRINFTVEELSK